MSTGGGGGGGGGGARLLLGRDATDDAPACAERK